MVLLRKKKTFQQVRRKTSVHTTKAKGARKITPKAIDSQFRDSMIRERAYFIWEERGRPQAQDFDIWVQAEKDIRAQMKLS